MIFMDTAHWIGETLSVSSELKIETGVKSSKQKLLQPLFPKTYI